MKQPEQPVVRWHATMSIDGFVAAPGDAMEWMSPFVTGSPNPSIDRLLANLGAVVMGRRTFDLPGDGGVYGGMWTGPQFVLSHRDLPADTKGFRRVDGDLAAVSATVRDAAGGKDVAILGADTAGQFARAGLVDELLLHVLPVLLGDGVRLHGAVGCAPTHLELRESFRVDQTVTMSMGFLDVADLSSTAQR